MGKSVCATAVKAVSVFFALTLLCGVVYPLAVTGCTFVFFPKQASGSLVPGGSMLIGQQVSDPHFLIGRPFAAGGSGPTNLSSVSKEQAGKIIARKAWWHSIDPENMDPVPGELLSVSGSGVDPDISPEAAEYQVPRIARLRSMPEEKIRTIIKTCTTERFLGFWGERTVLVLAVNRALKDAGNER